jgi:formylglycine-generating enzyme required for sulfatase activity
MKKRIILLAGMAFVALALVSCSDDDTTDPINSAPVIASLVSDPATVDLLQTSSVTCTATDADGDFLTYAWSSSSGTIVGTGSTITWTAPATAGVCTLECSVGDGQETVSDSVVITVVEVLLPVNNAPAITSLVADPATVEILLTSTVTCTATDTDADDVLSYAWTSTAGTVVGTGSEITWTAPDMVGTCTLTCSVSDADTTVSEDIDISVFEPVVPGAMVLVQGGTFNMGDSYDEGAADELPVHSVTVGNFQIGKYEVTQGEWAEYMTAATYDRGAGANHPVYYASWFHIIKYCNLRSMDEGLTPCYVIAASTDPADWPAPPVYSSDSSFAAWNAVECSWSADGYRLPTEAEWEYAARGGSHHADDFKYSGGQTIGDVAWCGDVTESQSVGGKLPNQLGLYDMSGNLYEFCWDWFATDYYTTCNNLGTVIDPTGPIAGDMRMVKGGDWSGISANCRVAGRFRDYPVSAFSHTGFRVARTP